MPEIREKLVLEDNFSQNQDKYISKMEQAARSTVKTQVSTNHMTQATQQMSGATVAAARSQADLKAQIKVSQAEVTRLEQEFYKAVDILDSLKESGFSDNMLSSQIANADRLAQELTEAEAQYRSLNREFSAMAAVEEAVKQAAKEKAAAEKQAAKEAAAAVKQAAREKAAAEKRAAREAAEAQKKAAKEAKKMSNQLNRMAKSNPASALNKQFMRFGMTMFSVSRILSFLRNSLESMPQKAQSAWGNMTTAVSNFFKSALAYLMQGMIPGMNKLTDAMNSPSGQQFAAVFRELAFEAGQAVGKVMELVGFLVQKMGQDFQSMRGLTGILISGFQALGNAVDWVMQNWDMLSPIIQGVAAAILAYKAATLIAAAAQLVLMSTNPLGIIIMLIAVVIGAIAAWVNKVGGLQVAWMICMDAIQTAWDYTVAGFFTGVAWVQNIIDSLIIMWSEGSTAVANFVGDMKVNVLMILQNMVNGAIDIINNFISALNNLPGVNIQAVKHVTFATKAALENEAAKQQRAANLASVKSGLAKNRAERDANLKKRWNDAAANHEQRQLEIANKQAEIAAEKEAKNQSDDFMSKYGNNMLSNTGSVASSAGGSLGSDVSAIKKEVQMSDEELQSLVDLAQRRYVNEINLTAQSPVINVTGQNTGDNAADRKALADTLRDILIEQSSAGTFRSTARVY